MKIVPQLLFVCFQVWHLNDSTSCCVFNLTSWICKLKCTSCDEVVHLFIIIWSPWICEVWGPIRHGGEAGSESWRLWMVFKAADNVEAGRMIRRLLQTILFTYLSVVLYCAGFHGLLLIRTLCQWTFSIILYFACQHFCFAPQLWYGNLKWLLCNC